MNPNNPIHPRLSGTGYVPYFYQRGLHYLYLTPEHARTRATYDSVPEAPLFVPDAQLRRALDHPQTVEQIIARGYFAVPGGDPVTAIITDRQDVSRIGLDDTIRQIRQRYRIYDRNVYEIEQSKCAILSAHFAREGEMGRPSDSRQTYSLSKFIEQLYERQRDERTTLWQDVSRIKLGLPEVAQLYLTAYRKAAILQDEMDDKR